MNDDADTYGDRTRYMGTCRGGPLDGDAFASRYPQGFHLVNREAGEMIEFRFGEEGFVAAPVEGYDERQVRTDVLAQRRDAVAYSEERMRPWQHMRRTR
jgi:hypothetical protein